MPGRNRRSTKVDMKRRMGSNVVRRGGSKSFSVVIGRTPSRTLFLGSYVMEQTHVDELRDIYNAENQLVRALRRWRKGHVSGVAGEF